ncbi:patatin-like phospholipase family protein [Chitinophaga sp. Cy-1792]|uniref:patatin-like phospholipase family protein n=1 Tax=Chitinophaga sp. Cy-1792 TaxID=2608339 RepID=UPI001423D3C5|nr:patatin-like phospholipase family protein [Chitinophaga sp. Cy-1792]NIG56708.1 hypothetical protein [Chitinophaga sp. Cy-1792]
MPKKLGLSLSGGGYRAAAFHLGTLKKLDEMQILNRVEVLSTISGGSITGAAWCLHKGDFPSFHEEMKEKLRTKCVIGHILQSFIFIRTLLFLVLFIGGSFCLTLTAYSWLCFPVLALFFILLYFFQYLIFPVSQAVEKAYDAFFYHGQTLKDILPGKPIIAIGSSNLHTGRPFTFSQYKMSDSAYEFEKDFKPPVYFKHEMFPVSRAVTASSCVPFAFSPVFIDTAFFKNPEDSKRVRPALVDGGVYDNQGIHKLTQNKSSYECETIITSDAGGNFKADKKYPNVLSLLLRTVDLFMYRIKASQMQQNIYRNVGGAAKPIAYYSLGWKLDEIIPGFVNNLIAGNILPAVVDAHDLDPAWLTDPTTYANEIRSSLEQKTNYALIKERDLSAEEWQLARSVGTNLTALSARKIDCLIRQAENLTELQIKLYCPALISYSYSMS